MKQILTKVICVLLALGLILPYVPAEAIAEHIVWQKPALRVTETVRIPGAMDPDQRIQVIESKEEQLTLRPHGEETYTTDLTEVAEVLRDAMEQRQPSATVRYEADANLSFQEVYMLVLEEAMAHTGESTEGDYLRWQRGEITIRGSHYTNGATKQYTLTFILTYYTTAEQETQVDTAVEELLTSLNLDGKTDYEKLCAVYDWMCANITYDYDNLYDEAYKLKYTAYAALIDRTSVCQGYALLLYRLMLELGIDCRLITGIGNGGGHAWNIVELGGRYYNVDATWDASWYQAGLEYNYFLRSNATFEDHTRDAEYETEAFNAAYLMSQADWGQSIIYDSVEYMSREEAMDYIQAQLDAHTRSFSVNFWMDQETYDADPGWLDEWIRKVNPALLGGYRDGYSLCYTGSHPQIADGICYYTMNFRWENVQRTDEEEAVVDAAVEDILQELNLWDASDYEKIKGVYWYVCTNVKYWYEEYGIEWNNGDIYMALTTGYTVCGGYAQLVYRLLWELNVECRYVSGNRAVDGIGHAWNIVALDGLYYILDTTWGADETEPSPDFFLVSNAFLGNKPDPEYLTEEWLEAHPLATECYVHDCSGTYSNGIAWELDAETRILTITGQGEISGDLPMWDTWRQFRRGIKGIVIGEGITAIGYEVFGLCSNASWIELPSTLKHIGERAFIGCPITELELPEGVESIGSYAFMDGAFESLTLPSTLTSIGEAAFWFCENLRELTIKGDMPTVGSYAFADCYGLQFVRICGALNGAQDLPFPGGYETMGSVYFDREDTAAEVMGWDSFEHIRDSVGSIAIPATATPSEFVTTNFTVLSEITYDGLDYILYADHICSWAAYTEGDGSRRYCTICDARKDMDPAEHSYTAVVTEPGCYAGYTTYTCSHCGDCYTDHYTTALGHSFGQWEVTVPNSCTEDGVETHTCTVCGAEEERTLKRAHTWGDWYVSVEPGCRELEQNGEKRRDCQNCDHYETQVIFAGGHIYSEVITPPTCTAEGYTTYTCVCGYSYTGNVTDIIDHNYIVDSVTEPTCTERGYTTYTCTVCGDSYDDDYVRPLNHTDVPGEILRQPTCTETGLQAYSCSACGKEWEERLPATGHSLGGWYTYTEPGCYDLGHDGEQRKDCANCDYYESRVIYATGHVESYCVVVEPTCETSGRTEWYCECGYFLHYTDEVEPTWHANAVLVTISEPTCTEWGQAYMSCPDCGYESTPFKYAAPIGHNYVDGTCQNCGRPDVDYSGIDCGVTAQTLYQRMIWMQNEYTEGAAWTKNHNYFWNGEANAGGSGATGFAFMLSDAAFGTLPAVTIEGDITIAQIRVGDILVGNDNAQKVIVLEVHEDYVVLAEGDYNGTVHWGRTMTADEIAENTDYLITRYPDHSYGDWYTITEATCTAEGLRQHDCANCGHYETEVIGVTGHSYSDVVTEPTCAEQGFTTHTCACGDSSVDTYTEALGHDWNGWVCDTSPTCTEEGIESRNCTRCGEAETREIAKIGHNYTSIVTEPTCTEKGYATHTCSTCGATYTSDHTDALGHSYDNDECLTCGAASWDTDGDGVLEILAIGNSFSIDALEYAWQIANDLGIEDIVIGNLYISGCTLKTHATNAAGDLAKYTYYYNDNGTWTKTDSYKISTALESRSWDFVSMQQSSKYSGVESSYNEDLTDLIAYVKARSDAKLVWHMTWAYQQDSTNAAFPIYDSDQMTMYNAIVSAVQNKIVTNGNFDLIVPSGTAVQNSRTSLLGDTTTRDGYHMSRDYGQYLTGLLFIKVVTGLSVDGITYAPSGVDAQEKAIAIESVNNAYANPFEVTESAYTGEVPEEGYILLHSELYKGAYWSSTSTQYNELFYDRSMSHKYFATIRFTREDLPVGSIIILADGWQYRPEGWITDTQQTGDREPVTTAPYIVVTEEWWGEYTIRAFNISKVGYPTLADVTEGEVRIAFQIFVPEEMHTHSHTSVVTGPTCTEKGYTTHTCVICGDSFMDTFVDALGHEFGDWYEIIAPTCTEMGMDQRDCSRCEHYEIMATDANGHSLIHHEAQAPTCTEPGWEAYETCENCDHSTYAELAATGHSYGDGEVTTEPTCDEPGVKTYTCACGDSYTEEIPALGHSFVDGTCEHCGELEVQILVGDINGDGWVDVEDAMLILQLEAMLIEEEGMDLSAADVNGDGWVDVEDAMLILQFDALLIDRFPVEDENR